MGSYEIIPIGDKLKNLREKYNVRQADLAGGEITRNLISQIEHGKANLTKTAVEIILKNLKKICYKKHITIDEDIEYLMEDETAQANKILDKYIKELKDLSICKDDKFKNELNQVEEFLASWNIPDKKITIFESAGDYFCSINDFYNSSLYYEKAKALIGLHNCDENFISILRKLSMAYFYIGKYEEDIGCCNFALNHFSNMSKKYYCIFNYNSSLCYMYLKRYNIAIKQFEKIENIIKEIDLNRYYDLLIQKAICFASTGQYEKGLNLYSNLMNCLDKNRHEKYMLALINLADMYLCVSDNAKAKETLKLILENKKYLKESFAYLPDMYFEIAKIYIKLSDFKNSEKYYLLAFNYAKRNSRYSLQCNVLDELINIYKNHNIQNKLLDTTNESFIVSANKCNTAHYKSIDFHLDLWQPR